MYRKSLEKSMNDQEGLMEVQFVNRVIQLPVVTASWAQLVAMYIQAKESNRLLKYTLDKAETGVTGVAHTAMPLVNKFGKPITVLDNIACGQLDKLEKMYPMINKPAEEWVSKGQNIYGTTVKPSFDRLLAVKDMGVEKCTKVYDMALRPSVETCNKAVTLAKEKGSATYSAVHNVTVNTACAAKNYSLSTVQAATEYGKDKVSGVVHYSLDKVGEALNTPYGKVLLSQVDNLVKTADGYVDYYLPENDNEREKKVELDCVETETPLNRAYNLTNKTRHRIYQRALKDMQKQRIRTQEAIDSLKHTIDLIQYDKVTGMLNDAKTVAVDGARFTWGKLQYYWQEMNKTGEEVEGMEEQISTADRKSMERRVIATARHLTQKIKTGVAAVTATAASLMPAAITDSLHSAKTYTQDLYNNFATVSSFSDMSHKVLEKTREQLDYLTKALSTLTDYASNAVNLNWLKRLKIAENGQVRGDTASTHASPPHKGLPSNGVDSGIPYDSDVTMDDSADTSLEDSLPLSDDLHN